MKPVYAVVDTETTGYSYSDQICEIALVILNHKGELIECIDTIIRTTVGNSAEMVNGVTNEMIAGAPAAFEVEELIRNLMIRNNVTTLVAHNLNFDMRFLCRTFKLFDLFKTSMQHICTMDMGIRFTGKKVFGQSLKSLAEDLGVPAIGGSHTALADALVCAAAFSRMMKVRIPELHFPLNFGNDSAADSSLLRSRSTMDFVAAAISRLGLVKRIRP